MRIYFTGRPIATGEYLEIMAGRAVMYSFANGARSWPGDLTVFSGVALDSGAYSVWRRRSRVDIGAYADYCLAMEDRLDWYANLDVIGDWRSTLRNQAALERRGLRPVPVFHLGEPWGVLEDLVSGYERVGIGRGPGMKFPALWPALEEVFSRYSDDEGAPLCMFHGFRMTERRVIARFPFESVDSTTWIAGLAYGELPTDTGRAKAPRFLRDTTRARIWLDFFDAAPKALKFERADRGLRRHGTSAPERRAHVP